MFLFINRILQKDLSGEEVEFMNFNKNSKGGNFDEERCSKRKRVNLSTFNSPSSSCSSLMNLSKRLKARAGELSSLRCFLFIIFCWLGVVSAVETQLHGYRINQMSDGYVIPFPLQCGSVYSDSGVSVELSHRFSQNTSWWKCNYYPEELPKLLQDLDKTPPKYDLEGKTLFAGHVNMHYGHYLIETLMRLWPLMYNKYDQLLVFCEELQCSNIDKRNCMSTCSPFQLHLITTTVSFISFGRYVPPKIVSISTPIRFANSSVDVVESMWASEKVDFDEKNSGQLLRNLTRILPTAACAMAGPDCDVSVQNRCYMVRDTSYARMNLNGALNEPELEAMFVNEFGFISFEPGFLSFEQQMVRFLQCSVLVGRVGTSMHNVLFLNPNATVIVLEDNRKTGHAQFKLHKALDFSNSQSHVIPFLGILKGESPMFDVSAYRDQIASILGLTLKTAPPSLTPIIAPSPKKRCAWLFKMGRWC